VHGNAVAHVPMKDVSGVGNSEHVPRLPRRYLRFSNIYSTRRIFVNLELEIVLSDLPFSSDALKINYTS